jgi:hypothetical protein
VVGANGERDGDDDRSDQDGEDEGDGAPFTAE